KPTKRSFYAVLGNTNTWNAYNNWGGYSRYDKDREITLTSFERPNPFTSPTIAYDYSHPCHLTRAECWVLKWLNAEGYSVDVYSDYDFHSGIAHMDTYKALILTTHPEYWSVEMLDNLESYLNQGGSLLYLGGNGIFEKIKYTNSGDGLIFLDGTPQLRDNLYFRNLTPPRPERAILGVAFRYDNYWSATAPYRVINANHRFFTGTGLKDGDLIGHYGICGAASGREMDTSDMGTAPDGKIVSGWIELGDSGGNDRGTPPANLQILAIGINERSAAPGDNKLQGPHSAHMTYYDHSGGGFVLSAGSFLFGGSLVLDAKLQQIVRNALGGWLPDLIPINRRKFDISYLAPLLL
ncbi:MAG TPA: N,N-dimethylformamidase beta subunit family domain-containing protein, partial [Oculatellaceae cyanobacterium]